MRYSDDPRAARSREAMLDAARELLVREGPGAVTHQRIAKEAGVGRATVYRHWPRGDQLLLDVMSGADLPHFRDPAPPVRPWLHHELRQLADELTTPPVAAMSLTLMQTAIWDQEVARRRDASNQTIIDRIGAAMRVAVDSGELKTGAGPRDLAAMLVGPLVYRTTMQQGEVSDELIGMLIDGIGTWQVKRQR